MAIADSAGLLIWIFYMGLIDFLPTSSLLIFPFVLRMAVHGTPTKLSMIYPHGHWSYMPAPDINLRELACLVKYGQHEWYANRFTCVRCGAHYSTVVNNYLTPVFDYIKAYGR